VPRTASAHSRARRASAEALAEVLFVRHRTRLLTIARSNSNSTEEAEEAVQDALILFIEHFDSASGAPPLAWLTLTLKRRCWALYRRRRGGWEKRHGRDPEDCSSAELLGGAGRYSGATNEHAEEVMATRAALARLKRDERRALSLLALGYSYREIGELTGWTYTKVNRCLAEGRARLRELDSDG
jgi:RNA polymerase sigma factor (sigma-70 family)